MDMEELTLLTFILIFKNIAMKSQIMTSVRLLGSGNQQTNNHFKIASKTIKLLVALFVLVSFTACSPEDDIKNPNLASYKFIEDFVSNSIDGQAINLVGWTNYAETGTVKWKEGIYYSDKYAEFSGYQSGQASNIGWLISPAINMNTYENEKLAFDVAQAYVSSSANSIDLLVSTDFDGTNVITATWETIAFTKPPLNYDTNFDFFSSGLIDLSGYEGNADGNIYLAFKVKSSGTNSSLDGTYEIDNVRIVDKK